jgi:hypothetical protein
MPDREQWDEILKEITELCKSHGDSIADFKRCREFSRRLSVFLMRLEDMECYQLADRVMDVLGICSPKEGSRCENALLVEGKLERIRDKVRKQIDGYG